MFFIHFYEFSSRVYHALFTQYLTHRNLVLGLLQDLFITMNNAPVKTRAYLFHTVEGLVSG